MIDSYGVDVMDDHGKWMKCTTMQLGYGAVYNTPLDGDWSHSTQTVIEHESFDRAVNNNNIKPGETVRGWILLETPKGEFAKTAPQSRFHLRDSLGIESIRPVESLNVVAGSESAQSRTMKVGKKTDISKAQREFYSEVFPLKKMQEQ